MIYSDKHSWQNCENVQQILVFASQEIKDRFDLEFNRRVLVDGGRCRECI